MTPDRRADAGQTAATRAGDVALVGRPNVGKSSLLNAFTGERLSIVTPRAQTTRERVLGIYTDEHAQIVFVDTPGLLEPQYLLQRSMVQEALTAVAEADVVLLLLDATRPDERLPEPAAALLRSCGARLLIAINKVDAASAEAVAAQADRATQALGTDVWRVSAEQGTNVAPMRAALVERLPESPFLYPADDIAAQPVRFFVSELIRETIFEQYEEEIPYATVVRIEEFREAMDPVYIRATIYVERASQKPILVGRGGAAMRELGAVARGKIESFLGARVFLDLWVKVLPGWRRKRSALEYLGYAVPAEERGGRS